MKSKIISFLCLIVFFGFPSIITAQDLLEKLNKEFKDKPVYKIGTFKTTRIGLNHSIETRNKGILEISIYSRYWNTPAATSQSFLSDKVNTRFGLDYAFTNNFTAGFGYSNFDKIYNGFLKYRLIKQRNDHKKSPFSITLFQGFSYQNPTLSSENYAFTSQVLIAKKFNSKFSAQISPTLILRDQKNFVNDKNNQFAVAFGARHKISPHASIVSEYYYVANPLKSITTFAPFMVGVNWELSYIMLQFHITNARNFAEDTFITQTTNNFNFKNPNLHFGFNATFVLDLMKNKLK